MIVCQCAGVTDTTIRRLVEDGIGSLNQIRTSPGDSTRTALFGGSERITLACARVGNENTALNRRARQMADRVRRIVLYIKNLAV